jgi:hypothetical protein
MTNRALFTFAVGLSILGGPSVSVAGTGVFAEGVNDYSYFRSVHGTNSAANIYGKDDAYGFINVMTQTGSPWTYTRFWHDQDVYDTDFRDPDFTGDSYDDDTHEFDQPNVAFDYVSAHGDCDDAGGLMACTSGAGCYTGSACIATPPTSYSSLCTPNTPRRLVFSSSNSRHDNTVFYGDNATVKWGEDTSSGGWAGAGTNGGAAVIFIRNSCGTRAPFYYSQTVYAFAGAMLINFTMPESNISVKGSADTLMSPTDGSQLATYALANPNHAIVDSENIVMNGKNVGSSCPDLNAPPFSYGGGMGYSGCAADVSIAWDSTNANAVNHVTSLTWSQAANNANKPTARTYGASWYHCNYDCIAYPFTK